MEFIFEINKFHPEKKPNWV